MAGRQGRAQSIVRLNALPSTNSQPPEKLPAGIVGESDRTGHTLRRRRRDPAGSAIAARGRQIAVILAGTRNGQAYDLPAGIDGTCYQQ